MEAPSLSPCAVCALLLLTRVVLAHNGDTPGLTDVEEKLEVILQLPVFLPRQD